MGISIDRLLIRGAYAYLALPIVLFLWGWTQPIYAALGTLLVVGGVIRALGSFTDEGNTLVTRRSVPYLLGVGAVLVLWVFFSGQGGFVYQNLDHHCRNAIFRDLTTHAWPVYYRTTDSALVYYIAHWLPAALVGKATGWLGGNIALFGWTLLGCGLTCYLIGRKCQTLSLALLLLFIGWSGLDVLGILIRSLATHQPFVAGSLHLEWWSGIFQYSSFTTQLYWVFNQAVASWIVFFLLVNQRDPRSLFFTTALALPFGPLPFLGLVPVALFLAGRQLLAAEQRGAALKALCSPQNLLPPLFLALIFLLYFKSNATVQGAGFSTIMPGFDAMRLALYIVFCVTEFGLLGVLLFPRYRREPFFYFTLGALVLIPFFRLGYSSDFCMRASIPFLCALFLFTGQYLLELRQQRRLGSPIGVLLLVALLLGSLTPLMEIARPVRYAIARHRLALPADDIKTFDGKTTALGLSLTNFLAPHPQESLFFRVFGRQVEQSGK